MSAVLKTQATCPPDTVKQCVCHFISTSDIASVSHKKKQIVTQAESLLQQCRTIIEQPCFVKSLTTKAKVKLLGQLDCRVCRVALSKESDCNSIEEAAAKFHQGLTDSTSVQQTNPWQSQLQGTSSGSAPKASHPLPNYQQFVGHQAQGAHRMVVLQNGFVEGVQVLDGAERPFAILKILENGDVELQGSDKKQTCVAHETFLSTYQLSKNVKEILADWTAAASSEDCRLLSLAIA